MFPHMPTESWGGDEAFNKLKKLKLEKQTKNK